MMAHWIAAVNDEPSPTWDLEEGLDVLEEVGCRHVALRAAGGKTVDEMTDEEYGHIVRRVHGRGFEVVSYLSRLGSCTLDPEHWAGERERAVTALRRAGEVGCQAVRVMGYKRGGCPGPERFARTRERLARLTEMAESAGVVLVLETIFAPWESVGGSAAGCLRLVESIGSPHLRVCLDPGNAAADGEDPILLVDLLAPYVADVHVKDARRFGSRAEGFCLPGDGVCDWPHLFGLLRSAGYAGPFTLEPHLQQTTSHHVTGREGFLAAAARTRELLASAGFSVEGGTGQ